MAESQLWLKTLRRFGSRLSFNSARQWSPSSDSGQRVWQARYDHQRSRETDADTDGYSSSVQLVYVTRHSEQDSGLEGSSRDVETSPDSTELKQSGLHEDGEDRLAVCHETLNHERHPLSSDLALPDPESIRRRPLPPPPRSQRADDGRLRALSAQLVHLSHQGWYWGPLTLEETQVILADLPDGSYLVRDSHNEAYLLAIGLRADGRTVRTMVASCPKGQNDKKFSCRREAARNASCHWILRLVTQRHSKWHRWVGRVLVPINAIIIMSLSRTVSEIVSVK